MIIDQNSTETLQGVLAIYKSQLKFYPYENNVLQPYRNPIKKDLRQLVNLIENNGITTNYGFEGIIPKNVLNFKSDADYIVWTTEAKTVQLFFSNSLPIKSGCYAIPNLVWKYNNGELHVFATKSNTVDTDTILCQAPFLNTSKSGAVCMGSANVSSISSNYNEAILKLEFNFFNSVFTHTNTDLLASKDIIEVYNELSDTKSKSFNPNYLISINKTLNDIL